MTSPNPVLLPIPETGTVIARHYRDGQPLRIVWNDFGILQSIEPATTGEAPDIWVAPGLFDLQVNGYGGIDFQRDDAVTEASLLQAVRGLRREGCRRILLTLITSEWTGLLARIARYRSLIKNHAELKNALAGWHIEGPFLSDQPGYRGAHNPAWMIDPAPTHLRELREATGDDPVLLTLAAERPNAAAAIESAIQNGFVVSLGHTGASKAQVQAAVQAGAKAFTHLGNGCPQQLDRHENILWTVLNEEALTAGIIPDGIHVSPDLFRIYHRAMNPNRIYWTTDAMAAAGAPAGRYTIGEIEVAVGNDRVVRNPATNSFAGSALTPMEGIQRGAKMLERNWQEVWDFFSTHPASLMGLRGDLSPGSPAGFCLLRSD